MGKGSRSFLLVRWLPNTHRSDVSGTAIGRDVPGQVPKYQFWAYYQGLERKAGRGVDLGLGVGSGAVFGAAHVWFQLRPTVRP